MWPPAPQQSGVAYLDQVAIGVADVAGPTSHIVKLCIWSCHSTSHHAELASKPLWHRNGITTGHGKRQFGESVTGM